MANKIELWFIFSCWKSDEGIYYTKLSFYFISSTDCTWNYNFICTIMNQLRSRIVWWVCTWLCVLIRLYITTIDDLSFSVKEQTHYNTKYGKTNYAENDCNSFIPRKTYNINQAIKIHIYPAYLAHNHLQFLNFL